ncbi:MAG TPA: hypothetical protein VHJ38_09360 [Nitrososphaeraceae archaeon]|jgi:hypothetical protein|nr:hypothetical protein [Nitrososphaeraceae archaeon]
MIRSNDFGFTHIFINPSTNDGSNSNHLTTKKLTLVLFHGTGGK